MPSLATTAAAISFGVILRLRLDDVRLLWIAVIMLLVQFSIGAVNEWADRTRDAVAGRLRPIPLGLLSPGAALAAGISFAAAAIVLEFLAGFGSLALLLLVTGLGCGLIYDLLLKPHPLSFLPFAVGFPLLPIWVGVIAGRPGQSLLLLFLAGAPIATAIHLADANPDRAGDQAAGLRTLAVALGTPGSEFLTAGAAIAGSALLIASSIGRHPLIAVGMTAVTLAGALGYLRAAERSPAQAKWLIVGASLMVVLAWFMIG